MSYTLVKNESWQDVAVNHDLQSVPSDWKIEAFSDVVDICRGGSPRPIQDYLIDNDLGGMPWIKISDASAVLKYIGDTVQHIKMEGSKHSRTVNPGDLIVSNSASPGIPRFVTQKACIHDGWLLLTNEKEADKEFLFHLVNNVRAELCSKGSGSIFTNLSIEVLNKFQVRKPPLFEQTAIANILSDQETLIAHCNDLIALHEKRFAYLSDELLSGRLRLNKDAPFTVTYNDGWREVDVNDELRSIPDDWLVKKLGEFSTVVTGSTPITTVGKYWTQDLNGMPWYGTPNLRELDNLGYIKNASKNLTKEGSETCRICPKGTLLVSCIATIGELGLLRQDAAFNQQINGILPTAQHSNSYLRYFFIWRKENLKRLASTSVVLIIKKSLFETFTIFCPLLEEQIAIANVLSDQEALIAQYKTLRDAEKKRFDWLSDALLSGTYRVKVES